MSDKVRPQDLAKYLKDYFIPGWKERAAKSLQIYEDKQRKYESTWWSKLFRWKFDDSFYGNNNLYSYNYWDHKYYEIVLKETEIIADRITYHIKTNQKLMTFPNHLSIDKFYTWCDQNNIPY